MLKIQQLFTCLFASLLLTGCFSTPGIDSTLEETVSGRNNKRVISPPKPLPELPASTKINYIANDRDPMMPNTQFADDATEENLALVNVTRDPDRPEGYLADPLETYTLGSLKFIGVLQNQNQKVALILDPDGVTHTVVVGRYIGNRFGQIVRISENAIELVEKNYSTTDREWIRTTNVLSLDAKPLK